MKYQVYQITNKINGKIYIGKHECSCKECKYFGSGKLLKRAIKKYGIDNFTKTILFEYDNEQDMIEKEKELVTEQFCSLDTNYNLCEGGRGGFGYINSNKLNGDGVKNLIWDRKKLFSILKEKGTFNSYLKKNKKTVYIALEKRIKKYPEGTFKGKCHTLESKRKISQALKNTQIGEKNSQYGTMWITNGIENKKIKKQDTLPDGYKKGRI